jgi:hypothetical protein
MSLKNNDDGGEKLMKVVTRGKFVCCPKCGTRATVTEVGMDRFICKNKDCNARFGGWVVDGFVVTYEEKNNEDEDILSKFEACRGKLQILNSLI